MHPPFYRTAPICRDEKVTRVALGRRSYLEYAPATASVPLPLVVDLHGATVDARWTVGTRCFSPATARGAVIVYPDARPFTVPTIKRRGGWWDVRPCSLS